ncbi:restriction endonuclease subunit S [Staphylococcus simiae]|uniref:Type I restriction-modification system specificity subunit n=1 Tax=Staphylococcus simiae CCM 7213 = CCUG 51256 TaxID=911238 RepID=G5JK87_9STAP|nr:restriction endonuclease subunit S [Staphylococcus simiae]EHJ07417.1 Type I restriction-modification system specificity subunit [Staphylococcus simiae CCM 7213 = CCUG 51256]PNZ13235.1 restriction endonuclease subunit S [Staphylococcus simiae]SNV54714.1 type I restriction modification DNA specificity domain protein [Staphylococcus simiae]
MSNKNRNIPELRFPEFKGEWEEKKLGDIAKNMQSGGTPKTSIQEYWDGKIPWIQSSDLTKDDLTRVKIQKYITLKGLKNSSAKLIPANSIAVVTRVGVGKLTFVKEEYTTSQDFLNLSNLNINVYFGLYRLYILLKKEASSLQGTSIKGITKNDLLNKKIIIPPIKREQQKIGNFFNKLDQYIELEEQKLELLKQQKKGYMQKIFSQELRFKDENGNDYPEWENKKIKEIGNIHTGNTPSKKEKKYWYPEEHVWITPSDIGDSKDLYNSNYKLSKIGYDKRAIKLPANTLLMTCIASIGKNGVLRVSGSCNQQINAIVPFKNINIDYLYYISYSLSKYMKMIAGQTATQIVNKSAFEQIKIYLPSYQEQTKIGNFFSKLDNLIEKQSYKIDLLKQRKKAFLQKMFV